MGRARREERVGVLWGFSKSSDVQGEAIQRPLKSRASCASGGISGLGRGLSRRTGRRFAGPLQIKRCSRRGHKAPNTELCIMSIRTDLSRGAGSSRRTGRRFAGLLQIKRCSRRGHTAPPKKPCIMCIRRDLWPGGACREGPGRVLRGLSKSSDVQGGAIKLQTQSCAS